MTTLEILKAAKAKIEDPAHWTRGDYARDAAGFPVSASSPNAKRLTAIGAVRTSGDGDYMHVLLAENLLCMAAETVYGIRSIAKVNDSLGHKSVMVMYDYAIAELEQL